jgi:hypothetical protein
VSALLAFDREGGLEEIFIVGKGEVVSAIKRKIGACN